MSINIYADGLTTFKQLMISPATVNRVENKGRRREQHLALATASKTTTCKVDSYDTVAMKDYKERVGPRENVLTGNT